MKTLFILINFALLFIVFPLGRSGGAFAQWEQIGPPGLTIYSLAINSPNIFAGTSGHGVYLSTNNGASWAQTSLNSGDVFSLAVSGSNVFAGSSYGGIYVSPDNGETWVHHTLDTGIYINSLAVSSSNVFASSLGGGWNGYPGVFLSTDNGQTWTCITHMGFSSLVVSRSNVYAGGGECNAAGGLGWLYRSSDNGLTWTQLFMGPQRPIINSIAISGSNIFAGITPCDMNDGYNIELGEYALLVYVSTDNGITWTYHTIDTTSVYLPEVSSLTVSGLNLLAGTYGYPTGSGIYLSTDNGQNWTAWNDGGMGGKSVNSLVVSTDFIFAGTQGYSVWKRSLSELTVVNNIKSSIPKSYNLYQNYPNPFNPATTIRYALPKASFITLKVYDLVGREVATLVNEELKPGKYEVKWDGSKYSSGVYFYKLIAGGFIETKKMVLAK